MAWHVAAVAAALLAAAAGAQPSAADCAAIEDNAERLACYDRAASAASEQERQAPAAGRSAPPSAGDRAEPDQQQTSASRAPAERETQDSAAEPGPTLVSIVEVHERPSGAVFVTEEGDVWLQSDSRRLFPPPTPFTAELRPGALGSTFLVPPAGRAIRVREP